MQSNVYKINLKYIEKSLEKLELFKIAKAMPKGLLLHAHFGTSVNITKFINYVKITDNNKYNNIYYVSDASKIIDYINYMNKYHNDIWSKNIYFNVPNSIYSIFNKKSDQFYNIYHNIGYFEAPPPVPAGRKFQN